MNRRSIFSIIGAAGTALLTRLLSATTLSQHPTEVPEDPPLVLDAKWERTAAEARGIIAIPFAEGFEWSKGADGYMTVRVKTNAVFESTFTLPDFGRPVARSTAGFYAEASVIAITSKLCEHYGIHGGYSKPL